MTQDELREQSLEQLAIEGGKLLGAEDIVFEGSKFVIPETVTDLDEAIGFLQQRRDDEENITKYRRTFNYRPLDGARATARAITDGMGFTVGKTLHSFFGRHLPELVTVKTGPGEEDEEQVPWGAMTIPGLQNTVVHLGQTTDADLGTVFHIQVDAPRKYRWHIKGLFQRIERQLKEHSIYRGKAIDGQDHFIDVRTVNPDEIIYTERVNRRLETEVWDRIRYADTFAKLGQSTKRAFLLEGPPGGGKTSAADITAQVALEHGWTFLFCRPGKDDITTVMQTARMYQPAVVFREDLDNVARAGSHDIEATLDLMDGIDTKGLRLMVIMTTNHADEIHQGMIRPGRLHGIIHVGAMDAPGIERLARKVVGAGLEADIEWPAVVEAMNGYMPAFVREAFDRAVGYSVSANNGKLGKISTSDLVGAADSLREQLAMMEAASDQRSPDSLTQALRTTVAEVINATEIHDEDDGYHRFDLAVAKANGDS